MSKKRAWVMFFLPFLLAGFLHSQSLAELAKKEKERRAALKGKPTIITNADLAKVTKKPAVEIAAAAEGEAGEEAAPPEGTETGEAAGQAAPATQIIPAGPLPPTEAELEKKREELANRAAQTQEMVDLLTLKLTALYQEFQVLDSTKPREMLQAQISDTYDKLLKAQAEAEEARKEAEAFAVANKKEPPPAIWIR